MKNQSCIPPGLPFFRPCRNRWRLISLLIDTPISKTRLAELAAQAEHPFERLGLTLLHRMQEPLDTA